MRIQKIAKYRIIKVAGAQDKIRRFNITAPLLQQVVVLDEQFKLIDWNRMDSETSKGKKSHITLLKILKDVVGKSSPNFFSKSFEDLKKKISKSRGERKNQLENNLASISEWLESGTGGHGYSNHIGFAYITMTCLYGLEHNEIALEKLYTNSLDNPPVSKNGIITMYGEALEAVKKSIDPEQADLSKLSDYTGWIYIPGEINIGDRYHYEEDIRNEDLLGPEFSDYGLREFVLNRVSQGTGWCTGEGMEKTYLPAGGFWKYLENGKAKLSIREVEPQMGDGYGDSGIQEMQGRFNQNSNAYPYLDKFEELHKKYPEIGIMTHPNIPEEWGHDDIYGLTGQEIQDVADEQKQVDKMSNEKIIEILNEEEAEISYRMLVRLSPRKKKELSAIPEFEGILLDRIIGRSIQNAVDFCNMFPFLKKAQSMYDYSQSMLFNKYNFDLYNGVMSPRMYDSINGITNGKLERDGFTYETVKSPETLLRNGFGKDVYLSDMAKKEILKNFSTNLWKLSGAKSLLNRVEAFERLLQEPIKDIEGGSIMLVDLIFLASATGELRLDDSWEEILTFINWSDENVRDIFDLKLCFLLKNAPLRFMLVEQKSRKFTGKVYTGETINSRDYQTVKSMATTSLFNNRHSEFGVYRHYFGDRLSKDPSFRAGFLHAQEYLSDTSRNALERLLGGPLIPPAPQAPVVEDNEETIESHSRFRIIRVS
jgi:hypothetical protein